jgi:hypothetical protein
MKAKSMTLTVAIFIMIALSTACQRSESSKNNTPDQPLFLGKLDKKMSEIYGDKNRAFFNVCDYQWRPKILEISRVLEENRAAIEAMAQNSIQEKPDKALAFGSFKFVDNTSTPAGKDEWTKKTFSWSRIAKLYDLVKDNPKDPRWVSVDQLARGIVSDDSRRIVDAGFTGVTRDAGPMILQISGKAEACKKIETCVNPELSIEEESFLAISPIFVLHFRRFKNTLLTFEEKRKNLERFTLRLHYLAERYDFRKNDLLKVDGKVLIVPMNLTDLDEDGARLFIEFVEKTWNTDPEYSVKVESVTDGSPAFTVLVDNERGRAHVSRENHLMQLYNWDGVKVFIHEFGHILGLQDSYYTSWSTDTCSYTTESNLGDVMSSGASGQVLPTHWEKFKKAYWPE